MIHGVTLVIKNSYTYCRIPGSGKTLEVRTLGCARRSLPPSSHTHHNLKARHIELAEQGTQGLYWFGSPMWCNALLRCGVVDCLLGWGWTVTREEQPPEERCSCSWRACVGEGDVNGLLSVPPSCLLLWWLVLFIEALVLFPNVGGKGSLNDQIWRETTSTSYPD